MVGKDLQPEEKSAYLFGFAYSPGKHVFHVVFANKNPMKGFEAASHIVRKFNLTLLDARYTKRGAEGDDWSVFLHDGMNKVEKEAITKELLSIDGMTDVRVNQDEDGVMMDRVHFPLRDPGGERAYVVSAESLRAVFDRMRQLFGTGGEVVIYEEGQMVGAREVEEMIKMFGKENILPLLPHLLDLLQVTGVGKPEVVNLDVERLDVVLRIHSSVECEGKSSSTPYSRWIKGRSWVSCPLSLRGRARRRRRSAWRWATPTASSYSMPLEPRPACRR